MNQRTTTFLLQGGLDLVTPAIAVPPGRAIAALNYEPDVSGYRRIIGYERYDGRPSPHRGVDASAVAARRAAIEAVPGAGPVRGVWVYNGHVYAFRDTVSGDGAMYRDSASGWTRMSFGHTLGYKEGSVAFTVGTIVTGGTSSATGRIERIARRAGTFAASPDNTAAGYLVLSALSGAFEPGEAITDAGGGTAVAGALQEIAIAAGGEYSFQNYNFYGPAFGLRMYFANGVGTAFEWDGSVLAPILTGTASGPLSSDAFALTRDGDNVLARDNGRVMLRINFDTPRHVAQFAEHLFLSFAGGSLVFSGIGEPLDYRTVAGAGEIGVSDEITGLLSGATGALMVFARNRIQYLTGRDATTFVKNEFSDGSGAVGKTMQMMDQPMFLDDAGVRRMSTTDAFGDWRMGTVTQAVEPIFQSRRRQGVTASASLRVKARDQYRLFFEDGAGITIYLGREQPECVPFRLPATINCACAGEINAALGGERLFLGATNGFVYEMDVGTSFDGADVQAFIRLPWNGIGAPLQQKRFHKSTLEIEAPGAGQIGIGFDVDYGKGGGSLAPADQTLEAGSRLFRPIDYHGNIDWTTADQGVVETYLDGIGRNLALMIVSEAADEEPHTLTALTFNYSPRRLTR